MKLKPAIPERAMDPNPATERDAIVGFLEYIEMPRTRIARIPRRYPLSMCTISKDIPPDIMKDIDEPIIPIIPDDDKIEELGNVANKLSHIPIRNCRKSNARISPSEPRSRAILLGLFSWLV
jgi:hypothetical protein